MRRTPLRPVSENRRAERLEYDRVTQRALTRDGYRCRANWPETGACRGRVDPHHIHPVGSGGERLALDNIISLCRKHHEYVHNGDPKGARERGLLK